MYPYLPFLFGLHLFEGLADEHRVFTHRLIGRRLAKIMLDVTGHDRIFVKRRLLLSWKRRDFERDLGPLNPKPYCQRPVDRSTFKTLTTRVQPVGTVQITNPPCAILKAHLSVSTTNEVIRDANLALLHTADSKGFRKLKMLAVYARDCDGHPQIRQRGRIELGSLHWNSRGSARAMLKSITVCLIYKYDCVVRRCIHSQPANGHSRSGHFLLQWLLSIADWIS